MRLLVRDDTPTAINGRISLYRYGYGKVEYGRCYAEQSINQSGKRFID